MTIAEAAKEWNVKEETIMRYVFDGVIANLSVDNNRIILPNIGKPHYVGKRKINHCVEIMRATGNGEYIDAYLLYMTVDDFKAHIEYLIKDGYIYASEQADLSSNIGLVLTMKGRESLKKPKPNIDFSLVRDINLIKIGG